MLQAVPITPDDQPIRSKKKLSTIIDTVCEHFGLTRMEVASHRRAYVIVRPRQIFYYLAREFTTRSFPEIGKFLDRDHTTVLHGCRRIEELMAECPKMAADVSALRKKLEGGE